MCGLASIGESTGPLFTIVVWSFLLLFLSLFFLYFSFFFIEAVAKPSAFVRRGVCVLLHALRYRPSRNIYIYAARWVIRSVCLRSMTSSSTNERAGSPRHGQYQKGVCWEETWPTPRQRGIDTARSSFFPSKKPSTQIKELLEELKLTWLWSIRRLEDRPTSLLYCIGAIIVA